MQITITARLSTPHGAYTWTGDVTVDNAEEALMSGFEFIDSIRGTEDWQEISIRIYRESES